MILKLQVDETSCTLLVGFADGVMRTLFLHPDRMIEQSTLLEVRIDSAMTVHSASSVHADVIEMISVGEVNQLLFNTLLIL